MFCSGDLEATETVVQAWVSGKYSCDGVRALEAKIALAGGCGAMCIGGITIVADGVSCESSMYANG